ncbi:glycosyltransferase family 4 protein [Klebsiella aerogenes]|uniref:glycosyltransferase family 4 protein n=1 Tax=Klebsiella aerogenes TaxID=548 RepID=UPI002FF007EA
MKRKLCYFVNSAWYFELHWVDRGVAAIKSGYEVYVIANFSDAATVQRLSSLGFHCINTYIDEKNINPLVFIKDFLVAKKILDKVKPDILHCITIKPGVISCLWAKYNNVGLVYSFVGLGRVFESNRIIFRALKVIVTKLYRYLFNNINYKLVFEHRNDQHKMLSLLHLPKNNSIVIDGAGIDISYYNFKTQKKDSPATIFFAGRMLKSKGLNDLIQAKNLLKQRGIDCILKVAGILVDNDEDAISRKQIQQWQDQDDIEWLGTRTDIKELLEAAHVVALPSLYPEGIPRILLEAGAVGRPCVVYDNDGCNALIVDNYNGFVVERSNVSKLADKISLLITNPDERDRMGKNARQNIEDRFTSTLVIEQTLKVYQEIYNK